MSEPYFQSGDGSSDGPFRVIPADDLRAFQVADGVDIAPVLGRTMNINVVTLDGTAEVHAHAEEQIGYVVSGTCEFTDGVETWTLSPGDCYHAPSGAPHGARAIGGRCVIIDAFSPPRAGIRELLEG